jgi:hypothetical protein
MRSCCYPDVSSDAHDVEETMLCKSCNLVEQYDIVCLHEHHLLLDVIVYLYS